MSDELSFVEITEQYIQLLPARIVLSLFVTQGDGQDADLGAFDGVDESRFDAHVYGRFINGTAGTLNAAG